MGIASAIGQVEPHLAHDLVALMGIASAIGQVEPHLAHDLVDACVTL